MSHHDHTQGGCCGGDKHHEHSKPEKEKDGCCDSEKDKNTETEKPKTQDGDCCGGGTK